MAGRLQSERFGSNVQGQALPGIRNGRSRFVPPCSGISWSPQDSCPPNSRAILSDDMSEIPRTSHIAPSPTGPMASIGDENANRAPAVAEFGKGERHAETTLQTNNPVGSAPGRPSGAPASGSGKGPARLRTREAHSNGETGRNQRPSSGMADVARAAAAEINRAGK
jgi:hypothetical protein